MLQSQTSPILHIEMLFILFSAYRLYLCAVFKGKIIIYSGGAYHSVHHLIQKFQVSGNEIQLLFFLFQGNIQLIKTLL